MAYFEKVSIGLHSLCQDWADHGHNSYQMLSVILSQLGGWRGKSHQTLYWRTATRKYSTLNGKLYSTMNSLTPGKMEYLCSLVQSYGSFIPELSPILLTTLKSETFHSSSWFSQALTCIVGSLLVWFSRMGIILAHDVSYQNLKYLWWKGNTISTFIALKNA